MRIAPILLMLLVSLQAQAYLLFTNGTVTVGPSITANPSSVTNITNSTFSFSITASGTAPLAYQWYTNNTGTATNATADNTMFYGSTASTLWVSNAAAAQSNMSLFCIVTNLYGRSTSSVATLTVTNGTAGGGGGFSPTNITGYPAYAWYLGDDYSAGSWPDRFTNGFTLVNAGSSYNPTTETLNGKQVVIFDGSNDYLSNGFWHLDSRPYECFIVLKYYGVATDRQDYMFASTNSNYRMRMFNNYGTSYAMDAINAGTTITNKYFVLNFTHGPGGGYVCYAYTNAVQVGTVQTSEGPEGFVLGASHALGSAAPVKIAEVIMLATNFPAGAWDVNRSNVFYYLTNRYNLSVP